jgi:hypothetical protein
VKLCRKILDAEIISAKGRRMLEGDCKRREKLENFQPLKIMISVFSYERSEYAETEKN